MEREIDRDEKKRTEGQEDRVKTKEVETKRKK